MKWFVWALGVVFSVVGLIMKYGAEDVNDKRYNTGLAIQLMGIGFFGAVFLFH